MMSTKFRYKDDGSSRLVSVAPAGVAAISVLVVVLVANMLVVIAHSLSRHRGFSCGTCRFIIAAPVTIVRAFETARLGIHMSYVSRDMRSNSNLPCIRPCILIDSAADDS